MAFNWLWLLESDRNLPTRDQDVFGESVEHGGRDMGARQKPQTSALTKKGIIWANVDSNYKKNGLFIHNHMRWQGVFFICPLAQNTCHGLKLRCFKLERELNIYFDILKDTRGWSHQIWWVNRELFWLQWFRASLLSYQIQNPSIFKTCWWKVQNLTIRQ